MQGVAEALLRVGARSLRVVRQTQGGYDEGRIWAGERYTREAQVIHPANVAYLILAQAHTARGLLGILAVTRVALRLAVSGRRDAIRIYFRVGGGRKTGVSRRMISSARAFGSAPGQYKIIFLKNGYLCTHLRFINK
jgi:hypothetical protein